MDLLTQAARTADPVRRAHLVRLHLGRQLRDDVVGCERCPLHESSEQRVPPEFPASGAKTDVLFVGEAPGASEDRAGRPFVGPAGRLFGQFLDAVRLVRSRVWVANTVCCRPPANVYQRAIDAGAVDACAEFLHRTVELSGAWLVVALGNNAYRTLAEVPEGGIGEVRGKPVMRGSKVLLPTYHPAYVLRAPAARQLVIDDLRTMLPERATSSSTHLAKHVLSSCAPGERADILALWYEARLWEHDGGSEDVTTMQGRLLDP